jgi:hypothetical protein
MVPLLLTLLLGGVLVVTGPLVNVRLYDTGHLGKRVGRSQRFKSITRRPMTDAEYYAGLEKLHEDGPRYARHGMLFLLTLLALVLVVVVSLLNSLHF